MTRLAGDEGRVGVFGVSRSSGAKPKDPVTSQGYGLMGCGGWSLGGVPMQKSERMKLFQAKLQEILNPGTSRASAEMGKGHFPCLGPAPGIPCSRRKPLSRKARELSTGANALLRPGRTPHSPVFLSGRVSGRRERKGL